MHSGQLEYPKEVEVNRWDKTFIFVRQEDPESCRVGYVCPVCQTLLPYSRNSEEHMVRDHPNVGRVTVVLPNGVEETL